jgi:hypothetical protein
MPEYAPEGAGKAFAQSRACFAGMEEWLSGAVAAGLTHAELEEQADARGRELLRRMYQDHLDLRAACEQRLQKVTGADGVARTRAENRSYPAAGDGVRAGHGDPDRLPCAPRRGRTLITHREGV